MADNVKVAVRVRPFNQREIQRNATLIIGMSGSQTTIKDPENLSQEPKKFAFDFSYWSHDGYKIRPDGYMEPEDAKFSDQKKVFTDLGLGVLENAWKGYNCSLFAYGQTGSGKTYSMMGYGTNRGIVPLAFEELFRSIEEKRKTAKADEEYQVTLSMLEIYNEQVRDLLNSKTLQKGGLKVRQHPTKGFYVETLSHSPVSNYTDIDNKMNEGTRNRTVASTNMNATSSRAHTIVAINFVQKSANEAGQNMTKTSIINLVDLAGSERADSTGATGDRLKEGSAINQSLSTLGNVIKALADRKNIVPYRDSVLTKLLQNALGGNSKTIMIAALSPADINYEETLSTLRFADRAKAIKTKAVINESPTDRLIRELREENQRLMDMLKKGGVPMEVSGGGSSNEEVEEMKKQLEEQMKENQQELEDMKKTWEQRIQESEAANQSHAAEEKQEQNDRKVIPHLWNLNEDPALTGMVVHFVRPGKSRIGNPKADPTPEIVMSGLSIQKEHALINNKNNTVTLTPFPGAKVMVNGKAVAGDTVLRHNDRVMLGSNHLYVFHHPQDEAKLLKEGKAGPPPTFDSAQEEIMRETGLLSDAQNQEKSKNDLLLQEDLIKMLPMVNEANAMSEELDKRVKFELALISPQSRGQPGGSTEVMVKMTNTDNGNEWMFDRSDFINRKYLMQEMYQNYMEGLDWDVPKEKDPFWEPVTTPIQIGTVHVYLQSLGFLVEIQETLAIANYKGEEKGQLSVEMVPCNSKWNELQDEFVDDPSEMLSKPAFFKMKIVKARGLPNNIDKSYCKYAFFKDLPVETEAVSGTINPDFEHEKKFSVKSVSNELLQYLADSMLVIEVWGTQKEAGTGAPVAGLAPPRVQRERSNVSQKSDVMRRSPSPTPPKTAPMASLQNLVTSAKASGKTTITIAELEAILNGGGSTGTANSSSAPKTLSPPSKTSTAAAKAPATKTAPPSKQKVTKEKPKDQSSRACSVQ